MNSVNAFDVNDRRPDPWPKWLEQVLRRVEPVSAHDDSVRGVQEDGYFESLPANFAVLINNPGAKPDASAVHPLQRRPRSRPSERIPAAPRPSPPQGFFTPKAAI